VADPKADGYDHVRRDFASLTSLHYAKMDFQNSVWAKVPKDIRDHGSEPVAAISDPPTHKNYRDGGQQRPPKRKYEISRQAQYGEADPEDLSLHAPILVLGPGFPFLRQTYKKVP
jgi:hypothetical protein